MDTSTAIAALAALAQTTRLALYRYLVQVGPEGAIPSDLSEALQIAPSALSFHLKELLNAGLVTNTRNGRSIVYVANFTTMNELLGFLTENCCGGNPCSPISTSSCSRTPAKKSKQ